MGTNPLGVLAVLAAVLLVVVAGSATVTTGRFADDERVNATFSTGDGEVEAATFGIASVEEPSLVVSLQNGRSADRWEDGVSYGPPDYRTGVLVITGPDDLKLEITSDATEPLTFEIEADLVARALDVDDLRGVTATLDGEPLAYEVSYVAGAEHVVFTVDHFSTRYVVFAATEVVPAAPDDAPDDATAAPKNGTGAGKEPPGKPERPGGAKDGQETGTSTAEPDSATLPGDSTPTPVPAATETPTPEPTVTETPEPTETETPTPEPGPETPESTPTPTPEPTVTETPEPTATETPEPTSTETPTPEPDPETEATPTQPPEPTATETPAPGPTGSTGTGGDGT